LVALFRKPSEIQGLPWVSKENVRRIAAQNFLVSFVFFQFFENFGSKFSRDWEGISRDWEGTAEIGRWDISYRYQFILSGDMEKSASFSIWGA